MMHRIRTAPSKYARTGEMKRSPQQSLPFLHLKTYSQVKHQSAIDYGWHLVSIRFPGRLLVVPVPYKH